MVEISRFFFFIVAFFGYYFLHSYKFNAVKRILFFSLLLLFFVSGTGTAQTVKLNKLGKDNMFYSYTFIFHSKGTLYTIDNRGAIFKTSLDSGDYTRLGNVTFNKTRFFFGHFNKLYIIETDGSMNQIDPATGAWSLVSPMGTWSLISNVAVVRNTFYSIENGALYMHSALNPKMRKQVGESDFYDLGLLLRSDNSLHSIIADGSFYEINTTTGKWNKFFRVKTLRNARAGAVWNDKLYSAENPGGFFEHTIPAGERKQLEASQFQKARYLFTDSGKLYAIFQDGTLYEVVIE
jgi:hypothetical protein